jgi:integrase
MLPPFADNPFRSFPIDALRDRGQDDGPDRVFTPEQERAFFAACDAWQSGLFATLATYGLRVGELTHLLIEDVDFEAGTIAIRSKPELLWAVKTGRRRELPLVPEIRALLTRLIGDRKAGFVFLNEPYAAGRRVPAMTFASPRALRSQLAQLVAELVAREPAATGRDKRRAVTAFCRALGQIP